MITTKTGAKDSKSLTLNANYGFQMPGRLVETMNHEQFVDFINAPDREDRLGAAFDMVFDAEAVCMTSSRCLEYRITSPLLSPHTKSLVQTFSSPLIFAQ